MANNLIMVTKSGGTVTPKNDGSVAAAILPDCRLNGCAMSISGTTLTIQPGEMCICGRVIQNASASTISVLATGYLIATVTSNGISFSTSASAPTLTKQDINISGTTYQAIICQTASGSIVSELPYYQRNGGIAFGTAETPSGSYAEGTLYVQYEE